VECPCHEVDVVAIVSSGQGGDAISDLEPVLEVQLGRKSANLVFDDANLDSVVAQGTATSLPRCSPT
jgi:hypothetical protein